MKYSRRQTKNRKRRTKRGGNGYIQKALNNGIHSSKKLVGSTGLLVSSGISLGAKAVGTGAVIVSSGEIILDGVGESSKILAESVNRSLVGTSFTINEFIKGLFGFNVLLCKSILVASSISNLFLNNLLNILREEDSQLSDIYKECSIPLDNKVAVVGPSLISSTQCLKKYNNFLYKIHTRYLKNCETIKKRLISRINTIMKLISTNWM